MGQNIPGLAAALTENLAEAGINRRGFSAVVIGTQFVAYVAVDSQVEADRTADVLKAVV